jgi:hypothetical protein
MKTKWKLVTRYPIKKYACGLVAGQKLRLRRDLAIKNPRGRAVGPPIKAGEIWEVIPGAAEPPFVVWLRRPDGERHTWDDSKSIFDAFEILTKGGKGTNRESGRAPVNKRARQ